jgi:capsular polysaccharide biosynthesis protein
VAALSAQPAVTFLRDIAPDNMTCTIDATPFITQHHHITQECFFLGGNSVFAHWMSDCLPLLQAIELAGLPPTLPIVTIKLTPWQRDTLACLGFGPERIIELDASETSPCCSIVTFAKAWMADGFAMKQRYDYLRRGFARCIGPLSEDEKAALPKRFYITRPQEVFGAGRVSNEAEICAFLQAQGFAIVHGERMSSQDKAKLFGNAEIVICAPGSNGFNYLAYGHEDAILINMWPRSLGDSTNWTEMKLSHRYHAPYLDETIFVFGDAPGEGCGMAIEDPAFYSLEQMAAAIAEAEKRLGLV